MYNGNHHGEEAGAIPKPGQEKKPDAKSATIQKPEPQEKPKPAKN